MKRGMTSFVAALLMAAMLSHSCLTETPEQTAHPGMDASQLPKPPTYSNYTELTSLEELLSITGQRDTPGYIVLFCGEEREGKNPCKEILEVFKAIRYYATDLKQEYIYYNLNKGDLQIAKYFDIDRVPHILFIKNRRVYTYGHHEFSMNALASFVQYLERHPDYMWRHFPVRERTKIDWLMEGLYRMMDKIESMTIDMPLVRNIFYLLIASLGLMFAYGIAMFFYELITGNIYKRLGENKTLEEELSASQNETPTAGDKVKSD